MLKLSQKIEQILSQGVAPKSVDAETRLILFHFFREQIQHPHLCVVTPQIEAAALSLAQERAQGRPLQHLLGYQFFYSREYEVSPATLIPRPETEILIDEAIRWGRSKKNIYFGELGLGSGILSTELLCHLIQSHGVATEISPPAIAVAQQNLKKHVGTDYETRLRVLKPESTLDPYAPFWAHGPFDLFVSNPPYLAPHDEIEDEVKNFEPNSALYPSTLLSELDPNYYYREFAAHYSKILKSGGVAFFEVPHERAEQIQTLWLAAGMQASLILDLTGRPRVIRGTS